MYLVPGGSKLWRWKYRFQGKEKRLALGAYPEVTLAQARLDRDAARILLKQGTDPVQARKDDRAAQRLRMGTRFEDVARSWFEHWKGPRSQRHAEYVLRRLQADVFPALGDKPISEIGAPQLLAMAKNIEARGPLDIARRTWQTCGQVFEFALAHGLVGRNPSRDVRPGVGLKSREAGHYARVDVRQLPDLLRKLWAYDGSPYTRYALQLMALTFVRTGELIAASWEEIDLEAAEWRIPAQRMKMRTPHVVPLSRQAVEALTLLHEHRRVGELLFPGERDHDRPMPNNTILAALRRIGYAGRMTVHGFRGIASTILHEHGFDHAHIELQLAHMERYAVSAAYNFATYRRNPQRSLNRSGSWVKCPTAAVRPCRLPTARTSRSRMSAQGYVSTPHSIGVCMFDHIGVVVSDFAKSKAFYAQALAPIGHSRVVEIMMDGGLKPSAGFCHEDGSDLWISQGIPTRPIHIAFRVSSRAAVDAFHVAALAAGGEDNGEPGLRPQYHPNYYGAYVLDPDGHNIEAVCHDAPGAAGST